MAEELSKCGVKVQVGENEIYVPGGQVKAPDRPFDSHNDHRIAMALAVLSTVTGGTIQNAQAVNKSMPEFFRLLDPVGRKTDFGSRVKRERKYGKVSRRIRKY